MNGMGCCQSNFHALFERRPSICFCLLPRAFYTVREVSDTGRVRLESEQGFNRRLLPDVDVVIPEEEFAKTGKLRKRTLKRKEEVEDADYGWFTRGEIAILNPSQVEIAKQRPARAKIFTGPSQREKREWLEEKFGNERPLQKTVSIKDVSLGNAVKLQIRAFRIIFKKL